jgi:hypothetical protein
MFDAEIPIGENDQRELQCVKGIIHYFVPSTKAFLPMIESFSYQGKLFVFRNRMAKTSWITIIK